MTEPKGVAALAPFVNSVKSLLDKPLHQLTEDDIAQVTREDCRRYLKDKGMRRPSWNKSQAIQQVIMLKSLLETSPDGETGSRKRLRALHKNYSFQNAYAVSENVPEGMSRDDECVLAKKTTEFSGNRVHRDIINSEPDNHRVTGSENIPAGQMTIFYCGKVNVYDDLPTDKAQAIIHIAASPLPSPKEQLLDDVRISQPLACLNSIRFSSGPCIDAEAVFSTTRQRVGISENPRVCVEENDIIYEGTPAEDPSSARKASVQRYLDKKKDRFKSRTKGVMTSSCASLDIYFNHQLKNQSQLPQIRPPRTTPARCSSDDKEDSLMGLTAKGYRFVSAEKD